MTPEELEKTLREDVAWLVKEDCGCTTHKLDDHLAICVGWTDYGNNDWHIHAGQKVWTTDAMRTDYDWICFPYDEKSGEVLNVDECVETEAERKGAAAYLLAEYEAMKQNYEIYDDGHFTRKGGN